MQTRLGWVAAGLWVTACGPLPPASETGGEQTSTSTSTGDPTTDPTTTSTTLEPTGTSGPTPECQSDSDCDGYCEYCVEGACEGSVGCCGLVPSPDGELELRCIGYECYADDECGDGEVCDDAPGFCAPIAAIPVCERQPLQLSAIPLQGAPSAVALADLDGDAALDLIAALPDEGQVEVLLGDGAGGFSPGVTFATDLAPGTHRLAVADFDGDGWPDLALTLQTPVGELSLLFGQDAVFAAPVKEILGANPTQLWSGDFDGDGRPDLLTHNDAPESPIALRVGDGLGGFGPEIGVPSLTGSTFAAAAGPVTGDPARLDVAATIFIQPGAEVFELGAGPQFELLDTVVAPGDLPLTSLVIGDVDGDGHGDVVGHRAPGGNELLRIWSMQQALPELRVEGPVQLGPVADVDGDGAGELVTTSIASVRVIYVSGGAGPCVQAHALPGDPAAPLLAAGDVDGDGKADVIAGGPGQAVAGLLRTGL